MDEVLLPTLIDERARAEPDRLYCAFLKTTDVNDGVVKLSYSEFANAVNRLAWFIEETFGKSDDFTTLAYVGLTDIRYALITLAAAKTGHKVKTISNLKSEPSGDTCADEKLKGISDVHGQSRSSTTSSS